MKQALKKSNIKLTKTYTGKLPDSFGFNGKGGSYIRRDKEAIIAEQKSNGLTPLSFNPETGEIKEM